MSVETCASWISVVYYFTIVKPKKKERERERERERESERERLYTLQLLIRFFLIQKTCSINSQFFYMKHPG